MNAQFETLLSKQAELETLTDVASKAVRSFPALPNGLVSDEVKALPEYQAAKKQYAVALKALQDFNTVFCKQFKTELAAHRAAKRAARSA